MDGVLTNGMMAKVRNKRTTINSASSFSFGGVDLGATRRPKRFEWVKMNLDTGAAVNPFPLNLGPDGAGD